MSSPEQGSVPVEGLLKKVTVCMDNPGDVPASFERLRQFVNANLDKDETPVPPMGSGWDETIANDLQGKLGSLLENPLFSGIMKTYNSGVWGTKSTAKSLARENLKGLPDYFKGDSYPGDDDRDNMDDLFEMLNEDDIQKIFDEAKVHYADVESAQKAAQKQQQVAQSSPPAVTTPPAGTVPQVETQVTTQTPPPAPVDVPLLTEEEQLRKDIVTVQIGLGALVPKVQKSIYDKIEAAKAEGGVLVGFLGFLNEGVDMHIPMPDDPPTGELTEKTQQSIMALSDAMVAGLQITAGDDPSVKYSQKTKYKGGFTQEFVDKAVAQYPRRVRELELENPTPPEEFKAFLEKILKIKKATEDQATDYAILHGNIPENLSSQEGADAFLGGILLPIFEAIFPWFKGMFAYMKQKAGDLFNKVDGAFESKFGKSISQLAGLSPTHDKRTKQKANSSDMGTAPPTGDPDLRPDVGIDLFASV